MAQLKINIHDLHKSYGSNEVLKGITTKFYEGDVVCIIGPSGSGKSTFLRTMNLLETITSGQVTVDDHDLTDPKTDVDAFRSNIGMVFQHFNLFPHMTVLDNITFAPIEHKLLDKTEAEKCWNGIVGESRFIRTNVMPCQIAYLVAKNNV